MIKIKFLVVGNLKEEYLRKMSDEYLKRLSKFASINIIEFKELELPKDLNEINIQKHLEKEDEPIIKSIKNEDYLVLLDLHGKSVSSEAFADIIRLPLKVLIAPLIISAKASLLTLLPCKSNNTK